MQSPGDLFGMPSREDEAGWLPRIGQKAYRDFIEANLELWCYPARMPTGYGKTEAILAGYERLRAAGRANRLLIVVPSTTQETAYADDLQRKAKKMGIALTLVVPATAAARTLKYHRRNTAEVFVSTVQRLQLATSGRHQAGNWVDELLESGKWVGAADEYHHYASDNTWGSTFKSLTHVRQWMALSATPDRKCGPTVFGPPVVNVSYTETLENEQNVLKKVGIKVREYGVDIRIMDVGEIRRTTTELREQIGTEQIDQWEVRRQLRYLTKYCSPILVQAIGELESLQLRAPSSAHPQMLVYAFSCSHAKSLSSLMANHAPGLRVDWVGTGPCGRTDEDNARLTAAFLGGDLDALVQVNMAAEGFNSVAVCVIVDLSLTGFGPQKLQAYGRGTRYYHGLPLWIYVPTDSNVAPLAEQKHKIFDLPVDTVPPSDKCECCELCPDCEHHREEPKPLPTLEVLNALLIGGTDYEPSAETVSGVAPTLARHMGRPLDPTTNEEDRQVIRQALIDYYQSIRSTQSEHMALAEWPARIRKAVGQVARNVLLVRDGYVESSRLGDLCRALNGRWKFTHTEHDAMTAAEFEAKYRWLDEVNAEIIARRIPRWLA